MGTAAVGNAGDAAGADAGADAGAGDAADAADAAPPLPSADVGDIVDTLAASIIRARCDTRSAMPRGSGGGEEVVTLPPAGVNVAGSASA